MNSPAPDDTFIIPTEKTYLDYLLELKREIKRNKRAIRRTIKKELRKLMSQITDRIAVTDNKITNLDAEVQAAEKRLSDKIGSGGGTVGMTPEELAAFDAVDSRLQTLTDAQTSVGV